MQELSLLIRERGEGIAKDLAHDGWVVRAEIYGILWPASSELVLTALKAMEHTANQLSLKAKACSVASTSSYDIWISTILRSGKYGMKTHSRACRRKASTYYCQVLYRVSLPESACIFPDTTLLRVHERQADCDQHYVHLCQ
jgi:hypothetical protein